MRNEAQPGPATTETTAVDERLRLMRDSVVNNIAAPVSALVVILLVPVMLRELGQADYGLWIIATSMASIIAVIDLGLGWSVRRVVAADPAGGEDETSDIVRSAANVYVLIGVTGCIVLGVVGLLSGGSLRISTAQRGTAILVFWLVGATLCADHLNEFGFAVFSGLRRFKLINVISTLATITWAVGAVTILINGGSVAAVAACQLAVAILRSIGTLWLVGRLSPRFRFRLGFFKWEALRRHVSFAMSSMLTMALSSIAWGAAPVLIGFVSGSSAAVPFYVGQKFPVAVSGMSWRAAEVVFPAATENRNDMVRSGEVLRVGSRWVLILAVPFAALMLVFAPHILHAWLGSPPQGSVTVLRILAATVLADAVAAAPLHLMWGRGAIRPIMVMYTVQVAGVLALVLALTYPLGVAGAAWGMLVPIAASSAVIFVVGCRTCAMDTLKLAADLWRGLGLPALACILGASSVFYVCGDDRPWVVAAMAAGGLSYLVVLFGFSGSSEEKRFARYILSKLRFSF